MSSPKEKKLNDEPVELRHWHKVGMLIIEANKGWAPNPGDINPLVVDVERHLGKGCWEELAAQYEMNNRKKI